MSDEPRKLRTWSAFGEIRRKPSEYEIVSHDLNYTTRANKHAPLESNPTSPVNMWLRTYRDNSPLQCQNWNEFRDPDQLTYRAYTTAQNKAETSVANLLDEYHEAGHDNDLDPAWLDALGSLFCPLRFPYHGLQQIAAYTGLVAPTSYVTNASSFAAADCFRVVNLIAYRTTELRLAHPDRGFGVAEREHWQNGEPWQGLRRAIETSLIAYDFGEAITAANLVVRPTVEYLLYDAMGQTARANGDDLTWLLLSSLAEDAERLGRWSSELARFCVAQRHENSEVLQRWIHRWEPRADAAAVGLATAIAALNGAPGTVDDLLDAARAARQDRVNATLVAAPA